MKSWTHFVYLFSLILLPCSIFGQINPVLYGDEWIISEQSYFKFEISKTGIYRIPVSLLEAANIPWQTIEGDQWSLFSFGEEIEIRTTTKGIFSSEDFLEFYATTNDGSVDALLYEDPENQQLNPFISLYSNSRPYYLTWKLNTNEEVEPKRYIEQGNGLNETGLPPKEPYYIHKEVFTYQDFHHKPSHDGRNFIRFSSFDSGEGYGSELMGERVITIPVDRLSSFGVDPKIVMRFGTNVLSRSWHISTVAGLLDTKPQNGYGVVSVNKRFPLSSLNEGLFNIYVTPQSGDNEKHTLARVELHYPRKYEFDDQIEIKFSQQASIISRYIEISGFGGTAPILYNLTKKEYIIPEQESGLIKFTTLSEGRENEWLLTDLLQGVNRVSGLSPVTFQPRLSRGDYLIISNDSLISSGVIQEYADYRSSYEGGAFNTTIVSINDLTERFAYGIPGHPIAIKNLMRLLRDENNLPDYTFIIGKGYEYTSFKEGIDATMAVPTFGIPGSDNLFLAFDGTKHPQRAIGRLAAQTDQHVLDYLRKIKTHEVRVEEDQTIDDQAWKKDIIHLSGGSAGNQATIFRFLNEMGDVITRNTFGAGVFTFRKTTADPLQRVTTDDIMSRIDKGSALLTFFGHSAVGTFDFSLEDPVKYHNEGRNPIILSLGCHSGNIHTRTGGISEDFVLEKDRGAIAFIASSGTAYPEPQYFTGINFYNLIGGEMYGHRIGDILQRSLEARSTNKSTSVQTLIEQLTLHGDPAYRLGSFKGPDFTIDESTVSIEPGIINATSEKFTVNFDVLNLGSTIDDVVDIRIIHYLADGTPVDTQLLVIPAPANRATINIDLNNPGINWTGTNRLTIELDPDQLINEAPEQKAESNNELISEEGTKGVSFFVFDNSAKPIYPSNFGILNDSAILVRAAVNNGLDPGGTFLMQMDTSENFNSPLLTESFLENSNSIIDWRPMIEELPGRVYYWRIAPYDNDVRQKSNNWQSSSFIFLPGGGSGWNQSHFYQWEKDHYYKIALNQENRKFEFDDRHWDIRIKNEIRTEGDFWVYVNNTPWASLNPRSMGSLLSIFIWDRQDVIFKNSGSDYGSIPFTSDGFLYDMDDVADVEGVIELLQQIPLGARVYFHTMIESDTASLSTDLWNTHIVDGKTLMDRLEEQGAKRIRELLEKGTVPYTFIFDKDYGAVVEDIANNIYETIDLTTKANTQWEEGTITSTLIPSQNRWLRLKWEEEKEDEDWSQLLVLGVKPGGARDTLKKITNDYDINLTSINPSFYPQLELVYNASDIESKTAPQLKYWRVMTSSLPDAAFYATTSSFEISDTINAGESLILDYDVVNLSDVNMGPILIRYTLIDQNFKERIILSRSKSLGARDTINIVEHLPTDGLSGKYQVVVELNPNGDQDEITDCNNLGFASFYIRPDRRNPFLDVTFDGRYISNGDRVSSTPEIVISLRDEASYVLLDNPKDFDITIFYPQVFQWKVDTSSTAVRWLPATDLDENIARLIINPNLNTAGVYTLEVQAKDIAGNPAGAETYRITFEVNFSDDLPKLIVSPNPMTTSTEFSYYLDSQFIPDIFDLYIYTADGKLVRHVTKEEFGPIKRGINKYRWYGISDYGEPLTTGLYYYEFVNNVDTRKTKAKGSILMLRD